MHARNANGGLGVALSAWQGAAVEEAARLLQRLAAPLTRAVQANLRWRSSLARQECFEAAFDGLPMAVFIVGADAALLLANSRAERLLRAADGVDLRRGLLCAAVRGDTEVLHRQIGHASRALADASAVGDGMPLSLSLQRPSGLPALQVSVTPVAELRHRVALRQPPSAMVYVSEPVPARNGGGGSTPAPAGD
jgi:PAS domain-containing protein